MSEKTINQKCLGMTDGTMLDNIEQLQLIITRNMHRLTHDCGNLLHDLHAETHGKPYDYKLRTPAQNLERLYESISGMLIVAMNGGCYHE